MLAVDVFGKQFSNPFMNAAGVLCSTQEDLERMIASSSGTFVTKSCTTEYRQGNPEPRYQDTPLGSINSMGLPNLGFPFYRDFVQSCGKSKPIFMSVSGMTMADNVQMAKELSPIAVKEGILMELNLSCPNVPGKPQVGYDFECTEAYLKQVSEVYDAPFGIKLPPYFDMVHFDLAAAVFNKFPNVAFLTCVNSLGNGLVIDTESESVVIKPKDGFGGLGGRYILPTSLANVNAFYRRCPEKTIIGCGGVFSGEEAFMHILAGASLVQIGTALHQQGPEIFDRVQKELTEILTKKGYSSVKDAIGKLKTI